MAIDLSVYREGLGVAPDPTTIRGLMRLVQQFLEGRTDPADLEAGIGTLRRVIEQAAHETRQELRQDWLDESLRRLIGEQLTCFEEVLSSLTRLEQALSHPELLEGELDRLGAVLAALEACNEALGAEAVEPQCPRCGLLCDDRCPTCGLEALIPPPEEAFRPAPESAVLPAEYAVVYRRYLEVLDGRTTLSDLLATLDPVEQILLEAAARADLIARAPAPLGWDLPDLAAMVAEALGGLEQMRNTAITRELYDLSLGWDRLFRQLSALLKLQEQALAGVR